MMHAYDECYLDDAMKNLGEAMDYAVNQCQLSMSEFMQMFIASGYAKLFEKGTPRYVSGLSGTELVCDILFRVESKSDFPTIQIEYSCSKEYWCGWILAYYQWYSGKSFKDILSCLPMEQIERMYPAMHEASEQRFVDAVENMIARKTSATKLQTLRRLNGYSQRILAEKSGIHLRNVQQYEQRAKDINKAAVSTLVALAKTLNCQIEDLLE
ncbi:MAG: helix-turn-helix transcriptional regulator [Tyzzerella sp.]|nr:helix-turn-helix transcriptional regulator [Tyzzerella sp.]